MADVSHLEATRCMIVGGEVISQMTVQTVLSHLEVGVRRTTVSRSPSIGPTRMPGAGTDVHEAARHAEFGAVPSVGQPGERRDRTPESVNAFDPAELVVGPGRGAGKDISHSEAVTVSSFTWWWNPDRELSRRPSLGDRSPGLRAGLRCTRPHHKRGRNSRSGVSREARVNLWGLRGRPGPPPGQRGCRSGGGQPAQPPGPTTPG